MCCLALPDPAPAPIRTPTRAQTHADFLAWNESQPHPWPLCPECDGILDWRETHPLLPHVCGVCGLDRIEELLKALALARGKKARKKALKAIDRLARPK